MKTPFVQHPTELIKQWAKSKAFSEKQRVLWAVILKTWGWHKTQDLLALTQIAEITGIEPSNVYRAVQKLVAGGIITRSGKKYHTQVIRLDNLLYPNEQSRLSKRINTKDTSTKDTLQKTVPDQKTKATTKAPTENIIGSWTDAQIETLGKKFRAIGMELAGWDEPYADKTWNQRTNLRTENREKYYQKIQRTVFYYNQKGERVKRLAQKMCYEAACMVNDLGAMERALDDKEVARRKTYSDDLQEEGDDFVESKKIDTS